MSIGLSRMVSTPQLPILIPKVFILLTTAPELTVSNAMYVLKSDQLKVIRVMEFVDYTLCLCLEDSWCYSGISWLACWVRYIECHQHGPKFYVRKTRCYVWGDNDSQSSPPSRCSKWRRWLPCKEGRALSHPSSCVWSMASLKWKRCYFSRVELSICFIWA